MGTNEPTGRDLIPGFAAAIAAARESRGWSKQQLAEAAGLSFNTIYSIESEKRAPSLRVASAIADALGYRAWLHDPATQAGELVPPPESGADESSDSPKSPTQKGRAKRK
jgi:transcriptional regulator with XRE-family HTH domain